MGGRHAGSGCQIGKYKIQFILRMDIGRTAGEQKKFLRGNKCNLTWNKDITGAFENLGMTGWVVCVCENGPVPHIRIFPFFSRVGLGAGLNVLWNKSFGHPGQGHCLVLALPLR